jgi:hypothetical protein
VTGEGGVTATSSAPGGMVTYGVLDTTHMEKYWEPPP